MGSIESRDIIFPALEATFQTLVRARFRGLVKPPFNTAARDAAGFPVSYYGPLAEPAAGDVLSSM